MGILEVELTMGLATAMDIYMEEYEKRYKIRPVLQNQLADQTVLKDLIRKVGLDQTTDLIRTYLRMQNPWFLTKGHSLKVLQDSVNLVLAQTAKTPQRGRRGIEVHIQSYRLFCDKCGDPWKEDFIGDVEEFQKPRICEQCKLKSCSPNLSESKTEGF